MKKNLQRPAAAGGVQVATKNLLSSECTEGARRDRRQSCRAVHREHCLYSSCGTQTVGCGHRETFKSVIFPLK